MRDGICPKCSATDIYQQLIRSQPSDAQLPEQSLFKYLCQNCGYLETYMDRDQAVMAIATSTWTRIPTSASSSVTPPVTGETIRLTNPPTEPPISSDNALDLALEHLCPVCGAETIIPQARIRDTGQQARGAHGEVTVEVEQFPGAFVFKGPVVRQLYARICGKCGYTALFVNSPSGLYDAYVQRSKTL